MKFFIQRRPSGYMSPYPLRMFYGAWRASSYFGAQMGKPPEQFSHPFIQIRSGHYEVPAWVMHVVFRPFNTYRQTRRGERFC